MSEKQRKESLSERSARLETEAIERAKMQDALSPEPLPEEEEDLHPDYDEDDSEAPSTEAVGTDTPNYKAVIQALQAELDQNKEQMIRALAEAENTRRRAQIDKEDARKFGISGFAKDLLSVADNLRRALESVPEDLVDADVRVQNLVEGIKATEREMLRAFDKNNLKKINPEKGQPFDPNYHEVMFEAPGTGQPAGAIIEVIETGYMLNERLLRPARVGVAKDEGQGSTAQGSADPGSTIDTEA